MPHDFNLKNVKRIAKAFSRILKKGSLVVVGYDNRHLSKESAQAVSAEIVSVGHNVVLSDRPNTTPVVSSFIGSSAADAGVMITASHNPPNYNGFKVKVRPGVSAGVKVTDKIAININKNAPPYNGLVGQVRPLPLVQYYVKNLLNCIHKPYWKRSWDFRVSMDSMCGPSYLPWQGLRNAMHFVGPSLNIRPDIFFGLKSPEPIERNLDHLIEMTRIKRCSVGLAFDGDGDRLGVIDESGRYWDPHVVFPLLIEHLVKNRGMKGGVVQSVSMGYLSKRVAAEYGLNFKETKVGFKYISDQIIKTNALIGGEESGGYAVAKWGKERDGILSGLMVMEAIMASGKTMTELRAGIEDKYGKSHYKRRDVYIKRPILDMNVWKRIFLSRVPSRLYGRQVIKTNEIDGIKLIFDDDSWLLVRPSGTEPVIRIYTESPIIENIEQFLGFGSMASI